MPQRQIRGSGKFSKLIDEIDKKKTSTIPEGKSKDLIKLLGNPEALMNDKEARKIMENPQDLEKLPFDIRLHIGKRADEMTTYLINSLNLLKLVKRNIALIEFGDFDTVDVQADEV